MTISKLYNAVANVFVSKRGAAMVEYALLVGLIAVVAMAAIQGLGTKITSSFSSISKTL